MMDSLGASAWNAYSRDSAIERGRRAESAREVVWDRRASRAPIGPLVSIPLCGHGGMGEGMAWRGRAGVLPALDPTSSTGRQANQANFWLAPYPISM